jgi:nucleotide-binding universal stress UspA family protein
MTNQSSIKRAIWAVEPHPSDIELEKNTSQFIKSFTKDLNVKITPCTYLDVSHVGFGEEQKIFEAVTARLNRYKVPGMQSPQFITDEKGRGLSEQVQLVLEFAKSQKSTLIFLQTHAKSAWDRISLGSFAEELVMTSTIPSITINPSSQLGRSKKILFVTDFSKESESFFKKVLPVARAKGSQIIIFHGIENIYVPHQSLDAYGEATNFNPFVEDLMSDAKKNFNKWKKQAESQSVPVSLALKAAGAEQSVAALIQDTAKKEKVGLVALVGRSGGFKRLLLGSLSRKVLRQSDVPVWTMR